MGKPTWEATPDKLQAALICQNKDLFEQLFIYEGMSLYELSKYLGVDWTTVDHWRKVHGLPKHSEKDEILRRYGEQVLQNIRQRKSSRYSQANKAKAERMFAGKTLAQIHGEEKAAQIIRRMSESLRGRERSPEFKAKLSQIRRGLGNPNFRGGFYSSLYKEIDRSKVWQLSGFLFNRIAAVANDLVCEECGKRSLENEGHHLLPFSEIFGAVCYYASKTGNLNTEWVAIEMYRFHERHWREIYRCLCSNCHREIHRKENRARVLEDFKRLEHLLDPYYADPEPSDKGGAETIESTEIGLRQGCDGNGSSLA